MANPAAARLYATRARQLLARRVAERPAAIAPPLPPGRVVTLPGRGDVFVRDMPGPDDRPPLLLLHGWLASAELNWFGTFERFEGERRVVAIDHRGHGRGMHPVDPFRLVDCADDAAALVEVLGLGQVVVVGFSMGGPIGLLLASRHPHVAAGIVPASTAAIFNETWPERLRWRFLRLLELGVRLGAGDRLVARLAVDWGDVDERFAPHTSWLAGEFSRTVPRALREAGAELSRFDARPWAARLGIPAAMVVTGRDSLVPVHRQRALATSLAAAEIDLPDADHDVPITSVARFGAAIHEAVALVDAARDAAAEASA